MRWRGGDNHAKIGLNWIEKGFKKFTFCPTEMKNHCGNFFLLQGLPSWPTKEKPPGEADSVVLEEAQIALLQQIPQVI